jgi:hypothetical protein
MIKLLCVRIMIKISTIFLSLIIFSSEVLAGRTISDEGFYGTWSTVSSILRPKRQVLELSSSGGRWIRIRDNGEEKIFQLKKSDISIKEDLLIVDYMNSSEDLRLKMVLAGWGSNDDKRIFGTVYLYNDHGNGLNLINGMPMSFKSGVNDMPPQQYWSFFSSPKIEKVDKGYIDNLEDSLKTIEGISISEDSNTKTYSLDRIKSVISFTKSSEPSYPSAIGIRPSSNNSKPIVTAGKYEDKEIEFREYYDYFLAELEEVNKNTKKELKALFEKIEAKSEAK